MPDPRDLLDRVSLLARTERGVLAGIARAEGLSPEDAVDAVQDGLCTLLGQTLPENPSEWAPFLAGIVRNAARNKRRRHHLARPHEAIDAHPLADEDAIATDEVIAQAETHVRLRACVEDLCEIERAVVTLRMLEQKPGEDVGRVLGITPGHVAVLLHRAKHTLRTCMTRSA